MRPPPTWTRRAAFRSETIDALRKVQALSAAVPREFGGAGATVPELARMCTALGQHCASSAMVLAMHHIQVLCIARHCQRQAGVARVPAQPGRASSG